MKTAKQPVVDAKSKPCPFCGDLPTIQPWHGGGTRKRMIACENDRCRVAPMVTGSNADRARETWNRRR